MRHAKLWLLVLLFATTLPACTPTLTTVTGNNPLCIADSIITFSASMDTAETVSQVRLHNAAWSSVCNGGT